jgi:RecA-family ATPase
MTIAAETNATADAGASANTLAPALAEAKRFLAALAPGSNSATRCWTFQSFDDNKDRKDTHLVRVLHGSLDEHAQTLMELNAQGAGIFVTVNKTNLRGRKTENIVKVRAVFSDLDGSPLAPVLANGPAPHIIVESSPDRWHPYWLPAYVRLENFSALQNILIRRYGGDRAVHDLPRVMRLPGFIHRKGAPFRTRIHIINEQPQHKLKELFTRTELRAAKQARQRAAGNGAGQQGDGPEPTFNVNSRTLKAINDAAMANFAAWVPELFPAATESNGNWRVTSAALGRDLEEAISITAEGIVDFGLHDQGDPRHGKRTPIELVQAWRHPVQGQAAEWLRAKLNLNLTDTSAAEPLPWVNMQDWDSTPMPAREWAVDNLVPMRQPFLFTGEGAVGKSILELMLSVAHVTGHDWLGATVKQGPAIYYGCEDEQEELRRRLAAIAYHYGTTFTALIAGGLHLLSFEDDDPLLAKPVQFNKSILETTPRYKQMLEVARDIKPVHIGIDTSADVFGGSEIERVHVRQFVGALRRLARAANGSVVLIAHPSLTGINTGTGLSGSTGWHNSVRARAYLRSPTRAEENGEQPGSNLRLLEFKKNNYGPITESILLQWDDGWFVPVQGSTVDQVTREEAVRNKFKALLAKFIEQRQWVSPNRGNTYAAAKFAEHPEAGGFTSREFETAMQQLINQNEIHIVESGPPSKRRQHLALGPQPPDTEAPL